MQKTMFVLLAWTGLAVLASGCSLSERANPLTAQAIDAALTPPATEVLRVQARLIRHPLLPPLELDDRNGLSPQEAAIVAVLVNPSLRAVRDGRGVAAAQVLQAGLLPNPSLAWGNEFPHVGPDILTAYSLDLSWDIIALVSHSARLDAAKAQAASVDLDVAWQEWQVAQSAKAAAYQVLWLQGELELARQADRLLQDDLTTIRKAVDLQQKTAVDLSAAQQAMQLAQSKLDSLQKRGIEARQLVAGLSGLVSRVDAQEGQVVPAGGPLVEVVPADRIQVKLGVEPSDACKLKPGQAVHLPTVQGATPVRVNATLKMITQRVNPASRLVDAYLALPAGCPLLLETFVRARIVIRSTPALLVPRSAVLPEEADQVLFTVRDGKAAKRKVQTGLEDENNVELLGDAVKPGDPVVIEGNAELEDGMSVETEQAPGPFTTPAAQTRPAAGPG